MTVRIFDYGQLVYLHIYVLEDSDDVVMAMRLIDWCKLVVAYGDKWNMDDMVGKTTA